MTMRLYQKEFMINGKKVKKWVEKKKKINSDYNYKRFLLEDVFNTRPPKNLDEWFNCSMIIKSIKKTVKRPMKDLIELKLTSKIIFIILYL